MKLHLVSLGCDKNLVDAEFMLGDLLKEGFTFTDDENEADVIVINTCCFISDAKQESIDTILELSQLKENNLKALVVTGCLAQRYADEILEEIPEVDAIVGTTATDGIIKAVNKALEGQKFITREDLSRLPITREDRVITTPGHYEYLKIAEGCDKCCTYCIIPKIRGPFRSVPMDNLIMQARKLADKGVKELILVAQETTLYGVDLYGRKSLPELLCKLSEVDGIEWIRLQYAYPEEITDELIEIMSTNPKVCHYIDIPIQHASDAVLKRMGRRTNQEELRSIIGRLRDAMPDICIRTTLITGFPGESQDDFEEMYRFVNEIEFDRLGVFAYSQEENTPAANMPDQIDDEIKESRKNEIYELQQEISFDNAKRLIDKKMKVMIEGFLPDDDVYVGRSYMDAPDVDGFVFVYSNASLMTGDMVTVKITDSREYDLEGVVIDELA